ncbi:MAG TPA: hypothetical protein VF608_09775 [Thermoanaerobaculia bacterium]
MKKFLPLILLLAPLVFAADATPSRHVFPDDYTPQSCAPKNICRTVPTANFGPLAKLRGYALPQEWVVAHRDEMQTLMHPLCEKVANCLTVQGNHWVWCKDILAEEFPATCAHFTDPKDQERCRYFSVVFFLGQDDATRLSHPDAQACSAEQNKGRTVEGKLDYWIVPAVLPIGFDGKVTVHAIDSETHIPVMGHLSVDASRFRPTDTVDGTPLTGYAQRYKLELKRVVRADGHRDVEVPVVTLTAPGYRTETFKLPVATSDMVLEMKPKTLKRGKNKVTITAHDSVTGKAIDARVMGDDRVLGKTNVPFEVEWKKGQESPEIWVTSLYNIYDDVVLLKKMK